jgi:hypothetical protein
MSTENLDGSIEGPFGAEKKLSPTGKIASSEDVAKVISWWFSPKGRLKLGERGVDERLVHVLDNEYYLPTVYEVKRVLAASRVGGLDYNTEGFDCDDFAFGVKGEFSQYAYKHKRDGRIKGYGIAFGVIVGQFAWETGRHVTCFCVANNNIGRPRLYLVEPRKAILRRSDGRQERATPRDQLKSPFKTRACEYVLI